MDAENRPAIGLADLLLALHSLDTGAPGIAERIGSCLGFADLDLDREKVRRGAWDSSVIHRREQPREARPATLPETAPMPALQQPPSLPAEQLNTTWEPLEPEPQKSVPHWLGQLPDIEPEQDPAPFHSLLPANTARPVLSSALATLREGDEPDIPRLVEQLCSARQLTRLPRLPRGTLERGVDLLLDSAEGMTPFYDDLKTLARQVRDVVGHDRYRGYSFRADPGQATGRRAGGKRSPWKPTPGRPVLVATDFGIGAPPLSRERVGIGIWREFTRTCQQAGTPLVGLVPSHPARWPENLGRYFKLIHWDPRTRASTVRHLVGSGHAVDP